MTHAQARDHAATDDNRACLYEIAAGRRGKLRGGGLEHPPKKRTQFFEISKKWSALFRDML
jgi:hypothetical protein